MHQHLARTFVLGAVAFAIASSVATAQEPEPITDSDSYVLFAMVLKAEWRNASKEPLLLQRETDIAPQCHVSVPASDPDWVAVENNFKQENARVRVLQPQLPIDMPYRLIPREEIVADDARLARKYPGIMNVRPESMEYAAVSAVGFNYARTRAIVYVRLRNHGTMQKMELREGKWTALDACGWIY